MSPIVSIVIPTYNRLEYLEECLNSVFLQNYKNIEIIVCDGASTNDKLLSLLEKYRTRFAYYDSVPDRGHAEAIRRGFSKASGELLGYLCSDDRLEKDSILKLVETYSRNRNCDVFYGHSYTINSDGEKIGEKIVFPFNRYSFISGLPICQPATYWTREVYKKIGERFGGIELEYNVFEPQADLLYRFFSHGAKFCFVDAVLASDRRHPGCASVVITDEIRELSDRARYKALPQLKFMPLLSCWKFVGRTIQLLYFTTPSRFSHLISKIRRWIQTKK